MELLGCLPMALSAATKVTRAERGHKGPTACQCLGLDLRGPGQQRTHPFPMRLRPGLLTEEQATGAQDTATP